MPALGMVRGVTHAEYIRDKAGKFFFLEVAARVGGAFIADVAEAATGINLWTEWARIEVSSLRGPALPTSPGPAGLRRQRSVPGAYGRARHDSIQRA